ncbi:hypothetical protein E4H04_05285, partial [Candidatus Bathyarchaeota archaeon]
DEYYEARGWNLETGHPTEETLIKLSLGYTIPDFMKR